MDIVVNSGELVTLSHLGRRWHGSQFLGHMTYRENIKEGIARRDWYGNKRQQVGHTTGCCVWRAQQKSGTTCTVAYLERGYDIQEINVCGTLKSQRSFQKGIDLIVNSSVTRILTGIIGITTPVPPLYSSSPHRRRAQRQRPQCSKKSVSLVAGN